ncbi:PIR protein [Plasmodium yoelii]|uniref:PIR protein n=3 Tax=Plasmodium yoelii TaxID=5861 RepID=A0AAE9WXC4_PLAYO|nr:PIR protein [Plasmodium yoelii]EAA19381.1 putative yir2 protein [Plasmodium yoelii yoelii]WBY58294.1 PIR protein [Plasmodium yoelii yoelii]CDS44256.1 YIR protein [Plasmodium yoelii]VTZ79212.1 PIR protein [Plasmodium yoelii]|eukprot:XP_022813433.2 PIR protein [Plasmodium yoelii]
MDDDLCGKFDFLRTYLPDDLDKSVSLELKDHKSLKNYCPITGSGENECDNNLGKITAGFLWLLEQCYSISKNKKYKENNTNAFFLYMISWFSYKLNQIRGHDSTKINDFYTKHVINSHKYDNFTNTAYRFTELKEFIDERKDLLNINIDDLSKFYDAFKLLCNIHGNAAKSASGMTLSNDATHFFNEYTELNNDSKIEGTARNKILPVLSTDYDKLKNKYNDFPSIPEIIADISALTSEHASSSSLIGNRLFTVLSIFSAIAFFLGISYKYSLFGFRERAQKQYLREKIKNIKKKMNR